MKKWLLIIYKKEFFYLCAGVFLITLLGFGAGWMERFQEESAYREYQYNTGSYIGYFGGALSREDIETIASDEAIAQCGVITYYKEIAEGPGKGIWLRGANENYMLSNTVVAEGRLPEKHSELAAEKWVLDSLGIEAKAGETVEFSLKREDVVTEETFVLTGILENSAYTKGRGDRNLFLKYDDQLDQDPIVSVDVKKGEDLAGSLERIAKKMDNKDAFYEYSAEAGGMRQNQDGVTAQKAVKALFIAALLFLYLMGIWQLTEEHFLENMAKLRLCGFGVGEIWRQFGSMAVIFSVTAMATAVICGRFSMELLSKAAGLNRVSYIFWGEPCRIEPEIWSSWLVLLLGFSVLALVFSLVALYRKSSREGVLTQLKTGQGGKRKSCVMKSRTGRTQLKFPMEWGAVFLACLAGILFLTVGYQQDAEERMATYNRFSRCQNGDFQIAGYRSDDIKNGVSAEKLESLEKLSGMKRVDATMVLPVRVKVEENALAQSYYTPYNEYAADTYYKEFWGKEKDTGDLVYKSALMGYTDSALEQLEDYVVEGKIDRELMKNSNTAVLFVPQFVDGSIRQRFYKNAKRVVDHRVGDQITVKIRDSYEEDMESYWAMEDTVKSHEEQFVVGAIVYYPYLPNTSAMGLVNPDVIISDERMTALTGQEVYRVVNIQMQAEQDEMKFEDEIQKLFSADGSLVISNFLMSQREETARNQIFGLIRDLWAFLLGGGLMVCACQALTMQIRRRKKELALCRIVGFSEEELIKNVRKEGRTYFFFVLCGTFVFVYALQYFLYVRGGLKVMGLPFWGDELWKIVWCFVCWGVTEFLFVRETKRMLASGILSGCREE